MDEHTKRAKLKIKRKLLFEKFLKTPLDIRLAPEIKLIDDQVVECTDQISRQRERKK
jgi:hypothetical protein